MNALNLSGMGLLSNDSTSFADSALLTGTSPEITLFLTVLLASHTIDVYLFSASCLAE